MSKPKNMTPEQEEAWYERERARKMEPAKRAARLDRQKKYRSTEHAKELQRIAQARHKKQEGYKERHNAYCRQRYANSEEIKEKERERGRSWCLTETGKQSKRASAKKYYENNADRVCLKLRTNREYDAFMSALEQEAQQ